jgi:hypothetical protein
VKRCGPRRSGTRTANEPELASHESRRPGLFACPKVRAHHARATRAEGLDTRSPRSDPDLGVEIPASVSEALIELPRRQLQNGIACVSLLGPKLGCPETKDVHDDLLEPVGDRDTREPVFADENPRYLVLAGAR